jgi:hypothetical protein
MEAAKLGTLISPQELKALFESGLIDATRQLLRATLNPDSNRTLTDSSSTAGAFYKAFSAQKPESTVRTDAAILRTPKSLIAEPVQEEYYCFLEWRTPPSEEFDDLLACYINRDTRGANARRDNPGTGLCWPAGCPGIYPKSVPWCPNIFDPKSLRGSKR